MSDKKNPVYSNTDTSKVVLSDDEWQKFLPKDIYHIAREKGTEIPWSSKFENFTETELTTVLHVAMHCLKVILNLKAVAAGQVFINRSAREALFIPPTTHMA